MQRLEQGDVVTELSLPAAYFVLSFTLHVRWYRCLTTGQSRHI